MKKIYHFNYDDYKSSVAIAVDTERFTKEMAQITLDFYTWTYDRGADPIDEVVKKYALESIWAGMHYDYNLANVRKYISEQAEGFARLGEETGIDIIAFKPFELDDYDLQLENIEIVEEE